MARKKERVKERKKEEMSAEGDGLIDKDDAKMAARTLPIRISKKREKDSVCVCVREKVRDKLKVYVSDCVSVTMCVRGREGEFKLM